MANLIIVGTQWGCQGKSKIVDSLVHDATVLRGELGLSNQSIRGPANWRGSMTGV